MTCCPSPVAGDCELPRLEAEEAKRWVSFAGPGLSRIELIVPGIHCAACIRNIEAALQEIKSVVSARVNLTARRVTITWRDGEVEPQAFIERLGGLGYLARPFDPRESGFLQDDREGSALLRAFVVAGFAASNIMLFSGFVWTGADAASRDLFHWLSALIALPTVIYSGRPFFASALAALRHGRVNMDVPISLGVSLATLMSLFETINSGAHAYYDAAVSLLFFLLVGRYLDHLMRARARSAISQLMTLTPAVATAVEADGSHRQIPAKGLKPGMMMAVAAGERFAADGEIAEGSSDVDRSIMTGESAPEAVKRGNPVQAGMLNLTGALLVKVTATGNDTFLADLIRLMAAAEQNQSAYVRIADRLARFYSPAVHILAATTLAGWLALGYGWHDSLMAAIAVLIITCPCALGLAVPAVQIVASGMLFRRGIMIKDGAALEKLADVDTVVFDKTGTLTLGSPEMKGLTAAPAGMLALAHGLARESRHPLSVALAAGLRKLGIAATPLDRVTEHPGQGLEGASKGEALRLGSRAWCGVPARDHDDGRLEIAFRRQSDQPIFFHFEDRLRPEARQTVSALRSEGLSVELLSGDRSAAVERVAAETGIESCFASLSPQAKLDRIEQLRRMGRKVLMVGDGINDAPALAAGHVSMAPSTASDIGRTAAGIVFMSESLAAVSFARRVALKAQAIARQNFALAIGYNLLAVPIAMAGLATPLVAAVAMSSSSLIVIANALRLGVSLPGWKAVNVPAPDPLGMPGLAGRQRRPA
ncbi:heavy metal translocating P-type ATPase [Taklimakanibacter deserti]|uniref:heavy metal translocating P-type ATPase n=1 Tax=Taklimakanibacter deserti TaxID=2267839 RepID=UPI000E649EF0